MKLISLIKEINENKYNSGKLATSSYVRYLETEKLISHSDIVQREINEISLEDLRRFLNSFVDDYSNSQITKIYVMLSKSYKLATKRGYIDKNIMADVEELPKPTSRKPSRRVESLTIEEQKKLLNVLCNEEALNDYKDIILLMLYTGMRIGEVLALKYKDDIDFLHKELRITKTLTKSFGSTYVVGNKTKTYTSTRIITITPIVERILREALFVAEANPQELLFWDFDAEDVIKPYEVNFYLKRIAKKYKICPHIHNHMLRHTYATRSIEAGVPAVILQKKLGHKDVSVTLNTYTSVFDMFEDKKDDDFMEYLTRNGLMY